MVAKFKLLIICLMVVIFAVAFPIKANAEISNFAVVPSVIDLEGKAGEVLIKSIKIVNNSPNEGVIVAYINDYTIGDDYQYKYFEPAHLPESSANWVTISPTEFSIGPGETKIVDVSVTIPQDSFYGTHHCMLMFQNKEPIIGDSGGTQVGTFIRIGAPLLVAVKDTVIVLDRSGRIASFDAKVGFDSFIEGVTFNDIFKPAYLFKNIKFNFSNLFRPIIKSETIFEATGNTHVNVAGEAVFENSWFGAPQSKTINSIPVLPGKARQLSVDWENPPFFGPTKAEIKVIYPFGMDEWNEDNAVDKFWIVPWQLITIIAIIWGMIAGIKKTVLKKLTKKKQNNKRKNKRH